MTFHTCRFCGQQEPGDFVKYGVRHYAHLACLRRANTAEAFEAFLRTMPLWQLGQLPIRELQQLGVLELVQRIHAERSAQ